MQRFIGSIPTQYKLAVIHDLNETVGAHRDYLLLVFLSCVISTFGLVLNSGAVIIGAMLIAPLMSPILATGLSSVRGDLHHLGEAMITLVEGVLVSVGLSTLLGTLVSTGGFNFLQELPAEVTSRSHPTLFDLAVALAGGAAAAYALAQPKLSATLPGVAIATALMPPLCVAGIGLSQGRMDISIGAFLLFLANFVAIVFASSLVFTLVGFGPVKRIRDERKLHRALILPAGLMLLVLVPLGGFMVQIAGDARENLLVQTTLMQSLEDIDGSTLVDFVKLQHRDQMEIQATLRSPVDISRSQALGIQRKITQKLHRTVALKLVIVPITVLDPLAPLTETPTPDASGTKSGSPSSSPTIAHP